MGKHLRKYPVCTNCDFAFLQEQPDNFCPRCGQENHDLNVPFNHVALELLEGTIHYDSKFWTTTKYLLFYPGKLTNEFHRGRRMGYVPPIRLYVFISFVFFFLLSLQVGHSREGEAVIADQLKAPLTASDSLRIQRAVQVRDSLRHGITRIAGKEQQVASTQSAMDFSSLPNHASQEQLDSVLTSHGAAFHNWLTRGLIQKISNIQKLSANDVILKALKYVSVMMFVLMPVFALLLKLVFRRARRFYMEHLIFSIHLHCFFFVLYSLYMLSLYVFEAADIYSWVNLLGLLYLYLGLRRVFKRSYGRTFFNMAAVLFLYLIAGMGTLLLGLVVSIAI